MNKITLSHCIICDIHLSHKKYCIQHSIMMKCTFLVGLEIYCVTNLFCHFLPHGFIKHHAKFRVALLKSQIITNILEKVILQFLFTFSQFKCCNFLSFLDNELKFAHIGFQYASLDVKSFIKI